MKIRKATEKDYIAIAKIIKEESAKKPYNENYTLPIAIKEIKDLAKNELFVCEIDKKVIGFIYH